MSPREAVLQQALSLAEEDRAYVADELERSLSSSTIETEEEVAAAWSNELDRRMAAYLRGETKAVSFEESLEFLRNALAEHRARRAGS
jgi:hypothetical protein